MAPLWLFLVYSCMYAFRKPVTAAGFGGETLWGASYKVVLVISQTLGYMAGKFYGIKFIATIPHHRRAPSILGLIGVAWAALLLFAVMAPEFCLTGKYR